MIAHVSGIPLEEMLAAAGAGGILAGARLWVALHLRHREAEDG